MALSMRFPILFIYSYATSQLVYNISKLLIRNGAGYGNRTHLSGLEGRRTSRCTNPAEKGELTRGCQPAREDRNFKERGEDFFFISCIIIIQKFLRKINLFSQKPSTIFLICFVSVRVRKTALTFPSVPTFDETLPILLERCADCFVVANIPTTSCLFIGLVV